MKVSYSDQQMIQRYVRKTLRDDELAQFECWLLDHPEMLVEVETQIALREGIRQGAAFDLSNRPSKSEHLRPVHKRGWFAAIASLLVIAVVAPGFLIMQQQETTEFLSSQLNSIQRPNANGPTVIIERTRSAGYRQTAEPDGQIWLKDEPLLYFIEIVPPDHYKQYEEFKVSISNNGRTDSFTPSYDPETHRFKFYVNSTWLTEGVAEVTLSARKGKIDHERLAGLTLGIGRE